MPTDSFPPPELVPPPAPPLIPKQLVVLAGCTSVVLASCSIVANYLSLPPWVPFAASALAAISAFLAGQALPGLNMPNRPLVPVMIVPTILSAATATGVAAAQVESPGWRTGLLLVSTVLAGIAGKTGPQVGK